MRVVLAWGSLAGAFAALFAGHDWVAAFGIMVWLALLDTRTRGEA